MLTVAAAMVAGMHEMRGCAAYVVGGSDSERTADAALVTLALGHAAPARGIGTVVAMGDVRIVRETVAYGRPAAYVFRRSTPLNLVGVWFDGIGNRGQAYAWARAKVGLPPAIARCFAARSIVPG